MYTCHIIINFFDCNNRINQEFVDNLRPFNMFCSVRRDCLETGECVIIIHCTSQFEILPDSTTCVVDDDPPFQCI